MKQKFRLAILIPLVIIGMAAIGIVYERLVQPLEPVWLDKEVRALPLGTGVEAEDFQEATEYAVRLWNDTAGVDLFVMAPADPGGIRVLSANGEPCGDPWRPKDEEGHSATAYQCPDGTWEIHVSKPGNIHEQLYFVAHEMGHIIGLADDKRGNRLMNNRLKEVPEMILVSDKDRAAVRERYQ